MNRITATSKVDLLKNFSVPMMNTIATMYEEGFDERVIASTYRCTVAVVEAIAKLAHVPIHKGSTGDVEPRLMSKAAPVSKLDPATQRDLNEIAARRRANAATNAAQAAWHQEHGHSYVAPVPTVAQRQAAYDSPEAKRTRAKFNQIRNR
jgi:hypothetical protein